MSSYKLTWLLGAIAFTGMLDPCFTSAFAGPRAETARKCMHYSYLVYPYMRPGSTRGSGARQAYFRDCIDKDGNVPEPQPPRQD